MFSVKVSRRLVRVTYEVYPSEERWMDSSIDLLAKRAGKSEQVCTAAFSSLYPMAFGQRACLGSITGWLLSALSSAPLLRSELLITASMKCSHVFY